MTKDWFCHIMNNSINSCVCHNDKRRSFPYVLLLKDKFLFTNTLGCTLWSCYKAITWDFFSISSLGIALNKGVPKNRSFWSLGHFWAFAPHGYWMPSSRNFFCHFQAERSTSSVGVSAFQPSTLLALSTLPQTCSISPSRRGA